MAISALPASGSTSWYQWATDMDTAGRLIGSGVLPMFTPRVGEWIHHPTFSVSGSGHAPGVASLGPIFLPAGTYGAIAFQVYPTPPSAGALASVVAYNDDGTGYPGGSLVFQSAQVNLGAATGIKQITGLSLVIPAGGKLLWTGVVQQTAGLATNPDFLCANSWQGVGEVVWPSTQIDSYTYPAWQATGITGTAPTTLTGLTRTGQSPRLAFQRSA